MPPPSKRQQTRGLQRSMNQFTKKYLYDVAPIVVDGDMGPATKKRIKEVKYYLGRNRRSPEASPRFRRATRHPRTLRYSNAKQLRRAVRRRQKQRRDARKHKRVAQRTTGASSWAGGKVVANWLHPYLDYARAHGWQGIVASGWRDPVYSQSLCYRMCGRPSCPGRCAGTASNHSGSTKPAGAIDVTDYARFGQIMRSCPLEPRIYCGLGRADPVHFSASGR